MLTGPAVPAGRAARSAQRSSGQEEASTCNCAGPGVAPPPLASAPGIRAGSPGPVGQTAVPTAAAISPALPPQWSTPPPGTHWPSALSPTTAVHATPWHTLAISSDPLPSMPPPGTHELVYTESPYHLAAPQPALTLHPRACFFLQLPKIWLNGCGSCQGPGLPVPVSVFPTQEASLAPFWGW